MAILWQSTNCHIHSRFQQNRCARTGNQFKNSIQICLANFIFWNCLFRYDTIDEGRTLNILDLAENFPRTTGHSIIPVASATNTVRLPTTNRCDHCFFNNYSTSDAEPFCSCSSSFNISVASQVGCTDSSTSSFNSNQDWTESKRLRIVLLCITSFRHN
jgi:hypothetical protein